MVEADSTLVIHLLHHDYLPIDASNLFIER